MSEFTNEEKALIRLAYAHPERWDEAIEVLAAVADPEWSKFLNEKGKVSNPNPNSRKLHPEVSAWTALKDPNAREELKREFKKWKEKAPRSKKEEEAKKLVNEPKESPQLPAVKGKWHKNVKEVMEKHSLTDADAHAVKKFAESQKKDAGEDKPRYDKSLKPLLDKYGLTAEDMKAILNFKDDKPPTGTALTHKELHEKALGHSTISKALAKKLGKMSAAEFKELHTGVRRGGTKLSDAALFEKFKAKAKPETKERMKNMTPAEFKKMFAAIMADEEEGGKKASMSLRASLIQLAYENPSIRSEVLSLLE